MVKGITHEFDLFHYVINSSNLFVTIKSSITQKNNICPRFSNGNKFTMRFFVWFWNIKWTYILTCKIQFREFFAVVQQEGTVDIDT